MLLLQGMALPKLYHRVTGSGETGFGAEGECENSQAKGPNHDDTL